MTSEVTAVIRGESKVLHVPQVNINGTSEESLREEVVAAYSALGRARVALNAMTVNGRDWQFPGGPDEYRMARREHDERCEIVTALREELLVIHNAILGEERQE